MKEKMLTLSHPVTGKPLVAEGGTDIDLNKYEIAVKYNGLVRKHNVLLAAQEAAEIKTQFNSPLHVDGDGEGGLCLRDAMSGEKVYLADVARKFNDLLGRSIAEDETAPLLPEISLEKTREDRTFDILAALILSGQYVIPIATPECAVHLVDALYKELGEKPEKE